MREGKGTSYFYTKSPVFSALAAPKWNTGDFVVRHYTVATGTRTQQQQQNPRDSPCFERYSDARNTVQQRANDWVGHHRLQWYGTNSILVSKYSDYRSPLTLPVENGGSREILKRAPKSYSSGCQGAIEAGSTERILEVKLFGREEYVG